MIGILGCTYWSNLSASPHTSVFEPFCFIYSQQTQDQWMVLAHYTFKDQDSIALLNATSSLCSLVLLIYDYLAPNFGSKSLPALTSVHQSPWTDKPNWLYKRSAQLPLGGGRAQLMKVR